jgi:6-pyruvoyltetrahydropterin/6-carboxytetrahydropterin synthase
MEIFREFTFDAAHKLHNLPEGHKCARVHGHTYRLIVYAAGPLDAEIGWVVDFAQIKAVTGEVIAELDHRLLNDVPGLEQPTTELIAAWIWQRLKPALPELSRIELWENANSGVVYDGTPIRRG